MGFLQRFHQVCVSLLRNKCCIYCLVLLVLMGTAVIGAKFYIDAVLNESEEESMSHDFQNGLLATYDNVSLGAAEDPLETWEAPEDIRRETAYTLSGYDFLNRPVWILPFGKWNIKYLLNAKDENEKLMKINSDQFVYRIRKSMKLKNCTEWVLICDMEGYSYSQLTSFGTIKFLLRMAKKFEPIFEHMAYGFTVNMDFVSEKFVSMVMGSFMQRMETAGADPEKFVPAMLRKIPASQLPEHYGGAKGYQPVAVYD